MTATPAPSPLASAAIRLAERGFRVFPLEPGKKTPLRAGWQDAAASDPERIRQLWSATPSANIGILTGASLVVIDVDVKHGDGSASLATLAEELGALPQTVTARTPSGGWHYYFRVPPAVSVRNSASKLAPHIDVRGSGGYIVAPPSCVAGDPYAWLRSPEDTPIAELPAPWLKRLLELGGPCRSAARTAGQNRQRAAPVPERIPVGERNERLFRIACALRAQGLAEEEIRRALPTLNGRCDEPLPEDELDSIAHSASHYPPGSSTGEGAPLPEAMLVRLDQVAPRPVRWLWPGRVPLGKLTILDGDPGLGKSLLALDLAARVSTGREMPDGSRGDLAGSAGVVLLSAEDDPGDTIRPRLDVAGGDPVRVAVLPAIAEGTATADGGEQRRERAVTLADIEALRQAVQTTGARLVVVDPLMAYTGGTDTHVDAQVRQLLRPLAALAQETDCAIVVVRHLNKTPGGNPLYRGGGSIGIIGAARSGLLVAADPDDETGQRRVLAPTKTNLAEPAPALTYAIEVVQHETAGRVPRIRWFGESPHTAHTLLAQPVGDDERSAVAEAKTFLLGLLGAGPVAVDAARREARAAGIAEPTLRRAKALLGVRSLRTGGLGKAGHWSWSLPSQPEPEPGAGTDALRRSSPPKMITAQGMITLAGDDHLSAETGGTLLDGMAEADDLPFEEAEAEDWLPLDDDACPPSVRPDGPCPRCGSQLSRLTCWACEDTICLDCGAWTGSALRTRCLPCGVKLDQRERWEGRRDEAS